MLRDYQQRGITMLYQWFSSHKKGNPCLVFPTGAGKSWVIAALCRDALQNWPETRMLMLTHQKELIEQDFEKLLAVWPNAPAGIYSASLGRRDLGEPITFAGIQSVHNLAEEIGHIDLIIIDEAHLCNIEPDGSYRRLIADLERINPAIRIIGLTATPYRLGQGLLTDGETPLFHSLLEPTSIEELLMKGHLAPLKSKETATKLDVSGVKKRGGEFIESELAKAIDTTSLVNLCADEIVTKGKDYKSWIVFCVGIEHSEHMAAALNERGIVSACVTGKTPKKERKRILQSFKAGEIQCLTNANVLTTGFDHPDTDLVVMLRPTLSPALYVQMAGRGLRPKSHIEYCRVLDFAGNIYRHGPITNVTPPSKRKTGGEAPAKACPDCAEIVHLSVRKCPECGHDFMDGKEDSGPDIKLRDDDIMGKEGSLMAVTEWAWAVHTSHQNGKRMLKVTYYGILSDLPVTEYFTVQHEGNGGSIARKKLNVICAKAGALLDHETMTLEQMAAELNDGQPPINVEYLKDGKYIRIMRRIW